MAFQAYASNPWKRVSYDKSREYIVVWELTGAIEKYRNAETIIAKRDCVSIDSQTVVADITTTLPTIQLTVTSNDSLSGTLLWRIDDIALVDGQNTTTAVQVTWSKKDATYTGVT